MSRERFVSPDTWKSEQVTRLSLEARLLWVGIITTADDMGRRRASAHSLKLDVFPCDACSLEEVNAWRDEVASVGLIRLYKDAEGGLVLDIPKWFAYQSLKYISQSKFPPHPDGAIPGQELGEAVREKRKKPRATARAKPDGSGQVPADSGGNGRREGRGRKGVGGDVKDSPPAPQGALASCDEPRLNSLCDPAYSEPARNEVGRLIERWGGLGGFRNWRALDRLLAKALELDPKRVVAHLFEVDRLQLTDRDVERANGQGRRVALRLKRLSTLYSRLGRRWAGAGALEPNEAAWEWARSKLNGSASKKSEPASIGEIVGNEVALDGGLRETA